MNSHPTKQKMDQLTQVMVITMEECGELAQVCSKVLRSRSQLGFISDKIDRRVVLIILTLIASGICILIIGSSFISTILLFIFHNSSQSLTVPESVNLSGGGVSPLVGGGKPPF